MQCPFCADDGNRVIDSRLARDGSEIRRRRECDECGRRFTTRERIEETLPRIIKHDERREEYDRKKLLRGFYKQSFQCRYKNGRNHPRTSTNQIAECLCGGSTRHGVEHALFDTFEWTEEFVSKYDGRRLGASGQFNGHRDCSWARL